MPLGLPAAAWPTRPAADPQGHLLERLEDPADCARVLRALRHRGTLGETLADTILREAVVVKAVSRLQLNSQTV